MKNYFRENAIFYFVALLIGIVLVNIIASNYFFRIDLTEEKRYTISDASKSVIKKLDDQIFIDVYLEGDFPPMYKRLQKAVKETINELKIYNNRNIQVRYTDPMSETDEAKRNRFLSQLVRKGIQPTQLVSNEKDAQTNKIVFPGAIVSYGSREIPIMFLKGNRGEGEEQMVNQSIENIEYELITAIKEVSTMEKKKIAFLYGHGELDSLQTLDIRKELSQYYQVKQVDLGRVPNLDNFDALVMAKPSLKFNDEDKLKIDQFVVNGGKALFFIDAIHIKLDSLKENGSLAYPYELNLDDLFFKWGIRFNQDLVQDISCTRLPVNVGNVGNQPKFVLMPWRFSPVIMNFAENSSIVRNMDALLCNFVGTLDTLKTKDLVKTPLAFTSKYTKVVGAPVEVSLDEMKEKPQPEEFKQKNKIISCLIEGKFSSSYAYRPLFKEQYPGIVQTKNDSKVLFFADGDFIANDYDPVKQQIVPLGTNKYTKESHANKDFVVNTLNYMLDSNGLIHIRNKQISLRPLDKIKIEKDKKKWQILNVLVPLVLVLILGVLKFQYRKKKYTRF
ncbi:MAG: gliding motility-associated ABC transporter substrate-binding protein GldG [Cytophagales bacterium]